MNPIYPLDKSANSDGRRALVEPSADAASADRSAEGGRKSGQLPPLLQRILQEYSATGMPPAYVPKRSPSNQGDES
jgi:hypothetical protein